MRSPELREHPWGSHTPTLLWVALAREENTLVGEPPLEHNPSGPARPLHPWLADEIGEII